MTTTVFTLRPNDEFIELIKLLKLQQIAQSGGHAKLMVDEGEVRVNGEQESRKRKKLRHGDYVECGEERIEIVGTQEEE